LANNNITGVDKVKSRKIDNKVIAD